MTPIAAEISTIFDEFSINFNAFRQTTLKVLTFRLLRTSLKLYDTTLGFQQGLVGLLDQVGLGLEHKILKSMP